MRKGCRIMFLSGGVAALLALTAHAPADSRKWVAINDLKRHTCPSVTCGVVGRFFFGESVPVHESGNGWSRVTQPKSAACYGGESIYVESGPSGCLPENGITQGEFSEWVQSKFLATSPPEQPLNRAQTNTGEG